MIRSVGLVRWLAVVTLFGGCATDPGSEPTVGGNKKDDLECSAPASPEVLRAVAEPYDRQSDPGDPEVLPISEDEAAGFRELMSEYQQICAADDPLKTFATRDGRLSLRS